MGTLYLTEQGSTLSKHSRRLVVYKNEEKIGEFSIINVDRIMLFGNIQVTAQAIAFLLDSGIDLCYLTSREIIGKTLTCFKGLRLLLTVRLSFWHSFHWKDLDLF